MPDVLSDALFTITDRLSRSALVFAVIAISAAGVVATQAISQSATGQIAGLLEAAALDRVVAAPRHDADGSGFHAGDLDRARALDGVRSGGVVADVGAGEIEVRRLGASRHGGDASRVDVTGADSGYLTAVEARFNSGVSPRIWDTPTGLGVVYVGRDAATRLGISEAGPGVNVWLGAQRFSVGGIIDSAVGDRRLLESVVVSLTAVSERLGLGDVPVSMLLVTDPGLSAAVGTVLPVAIDPADPGRITVQPLADLGSLRVGVATELAGLLAISSVVLVILAVLSTVAVLANSVVARRSEIGLRRALGTSRRGVAVLFMAEGMVIGGAAGLAGGAIGIGTSLIACSLNGWIPSIPATAWPLGVAVGFGVGALATIGPAVSASRVEPALALRS